MTDIIIGHVTVPLMTAYPWNPGFGTKYSDPSQPGDGSVTTGRAVAFDANNQNIALAHSRAKQLAVWPWAAGVGFGTRYGDMAVAPEAAAGNGASNFPAWSADGNSLAVAVANTPYISAYAWSSGFGSKYSDPASLPPSGGNSCAFYGNSDIAVMYSQSSTPKCNVYPWGPGPDPEDDPLAWNKANFVDFIQ